MIIPCAFLQSVILVGDGPTVELVLLPEFEFEFEDEVEDGEEADAELVDEEDEEEEEEMNGFESEDRDAADRSNVNCRILSGPCWFSVYVSLVESMALPSFQAQIQGEESEVALESNVHVVPVNTPISTSSPYLRPSVFLRGRTSNVRSHNSTTDTTPLQQLHPTHQRAIKDRLHMSLVPIPCADRNIVIPIRVHHKDMRTRHLLSDS